MVKTLSEVRARQLLDDFARWIEDRRGEADDVATVDLLLHYRTSYLDEQLFWWTADHLEEVLLELFPRKVVIEPHEVPLVVPAVRRFLTFLATTHRLDPGSEPLAVLEESLDHIERELPGVMADTSQFGMAKSLGLAMQEDGVNITDRAAVQTWIEEFNDRPQAERERLLPEVAHLDPLSPGDPDDADGELAGMHGVSDDDDDRLSLPSSAVIPPVRLVPEDELATATLAAPLFGRLAAFVAWVGEGRRLTKAGYLPLADGRELVALLDTDDLGPDGERKVRSSAELDGVSRFFAWANRAELVEVTPRGLTRTELGLDLHEQPLTVWRAAFNALLDGGVLHSFSPAWRPWVEFLDGGVADLLVLAYLQGELKEDELIELAEQITAGLGKLLTMDTSARRLLNRALGADVERLLDILVEMGVLERHEGVVALCPLGIWATNAILREEGYEAPVMGDPAELDASSVLAWCTQLDFEAATAELEAWVSSRAPADAVAELAAVVTEAAEIRPMLFFALGRLGSEAEPAVRTLLDDERLRPYGLAWLIDQGLEQPQALGPEEAPTMMVDQLAVFLAAGGPEALIEALDELGPPQGQASVIEKLWRVEGSAATDVIEALVDHPVKVVAKAARKALFKRRSSTGM